MTAPELATDPTLRAVVERMVPADSESPGWAVDLDSFVDGGPAAESDTAVELVRAGPRSLDIEVRLLGADSFVTLEAAVQDRLLDDPPPAPSGRGGGAGCGDTKLVVADASVHVTNGGVNPVLTVMALAYRRANHLATH